MPAPSGAAGDGGQGEVRAAGRRANGARRETPAVPGTSPRCLPARRCVRVLQILTEHPSPA